MLGIWQIPRALMCRSVGSAFFLARAACCSCFGYVVIEYYIVIDLNEPFALLDL